jgi:hypothetical protein
MTLNTAIYSDLDKSLDDRLRPLAEDSTRVENPCGEISHPRTVRQRLCVNTKYDFRRLVGGFSVGGLGDEFRFG